MNENNETTEQSAPTKKKKTIFSYLKWIPIFIFCAVVLLMVFVIMRFRNDAGVPYEVSMEGISIPKYSEVEIPFTHNYVKKTQIQSTGGCAFNLDDGAEELFLCGGQDQVDAIFRFVDGKFVDITSETGFKKEDLSEASMSATSLDVDHDGDNDLIVTRKNSIWLYTNDGGKLTGKNLEVPLQEDTCPLSVAVVDLNQTAISTCTFVAISRRNLSKATTSSIKKGTAGKALC